MPSTTAKISIGISSCLTGQRVRYDGDHQLTHAVIDCLAPHFSFKPFCPEMSIGLGVPREPITLIDTPKGIRCIDAKTRSIDVTDLLRNEINIQAEWLAGISGYIFKKKSPSCGLTEVKLFRGKEMTREGIGLFAQQLQRQFPLLPLAEEDQFTCDDFCRQFIERVKYYYHINQNT